MDLTKDISSLNSKIDELRQTIASYDKQLQSSAGRSRSLEQMFAGFKSAKASTMDINALSSAVQQLASGYSELTNAQSAAISRQKALQEEMRVMGELQRTIAAAQREALSAGDQQGATDLYQQYVATSKAMSDLQTEVELTGSTIVSLNSSVSSSEQTLNRYNQVLESATKASNTNSIAELNDLFEEEKKKVQKVCDAMNEYRDKYETIRAVQAGGGLNPQGMEKAQAELATYTNELQRLSDEYARAAESAQVYADALGLDKETIPQMPELPTVEEGDSAAAAKNMKDYSDAAGDASTKLEDLFKKGAALGGLTYGVHKLQELAAQVMHTRSEFQQLEVAFTTMLGSKSKADALMQQLTKTAATTPFDLQSVSNGAKQLLAYGTAAGDVNDILVHLGDIAAGLSQPLDALVYLYGTTMVQGRMMTMDLRQFQNRGIPIAEQLAKQFGVAKSEVQGLVSAGRVTADEFHKAVMGMASDGGKFAGLMAAQSKTIGGQISNIEDSIDMMFNEIGKSSEGIINMGLSGVSKLVENYESVGRTILNLVAVYGTYKTALIIVSAIEAAKNKQTTFSVAMGGKQVKMMNLLTKATWKQIAAQLRLNAAMLKNPAVAIATVLAVLVGAIITVSRVMDNSARITEKVNKKYDERVSKLNEEKDAAEQHIAVLKDETAANYQLMKAKDALSKMDLLKGKNIAGMTPEMIQQELDKAYQEQLAKYNEEKLKGYKESIEKGGKQYGNLFSGKKRKNTIVQDSADAIEGLSMAEYEEFAKDKNYEEKLEFINTKIKEQNAILDDRNAKIQEYNSLSDQEKARKYEEGYAVEFANWEYEFKMAEQWKNNWLKILDNIKGAKEQEEEKDKEENTGISLDKIINGYTAKDKDNKDIYINGIVQQEEEVKRLREEYAKKTSALNKRNLETAEANLKDLTDKYKDATGQTWTATKELNKQIIQEDENLARERVSILEKEASKRVQAATQYRNKIKDIEKEESEWKEKNPNRDVPEYFKKKKNVAYLEYKSNLKQLDDEFNDFIENIQRDTINIEADIDISNLERQLELASTSVSKKKALREEIFNKQLAQKTADLDKEKEETAEDKFGKKTIADYELYSKGGKKKGGWSKAEKETFAEMDLFYQEFAIKRQKTIEQMTQDHEWSEFNEELANYENYVQGMLDAEQAYQEQLKAIRERYGLSEDANVEGSTDHGIQEEVAAAQIERTRAQDIVKRDTGVENSEMVTELAELGGKVAGKAMEEIRKIYDEFIADVNNEINTIEGQKTAVEKVAAGGDAATLKQEAEMQQQVVQAQLTTGVGENGEQLSEADKVALLEQEQQLKAEIAYYDQIMAGTAQDYNSLLMKGQQLVQVRTIAEKNAANATQGSLNTQQKQQQKVLKQTNASKEALALVRDTANDVANTFGGALSQKGKKALNTMAEIADFGMSTISSIESLTTGTMKGMEMSAFMASESISTVEKASVILTIISLVIQTVMKIAEIASQFTKGAQLQSAIDDHLAKVDELKKQQQLVEAQYATSQGSDYYLGMAKAAKKYDGIIKETSAALADAQALYEHYASKNADSDKAKEAKAQMQDLQQQRQEEINAQIEAERELMEGLSGTSLDTFTSTLADNLIEGFKNGTEGIEDAWEDTMKNLKETMFREQLALALKDQFEDAFEVLQKKTADGEMSESDMAAFLEEMAKAEENAKAIGEAYYSAFQESGLLDDADAEGSEGFGQMTQDQADTLTARFTAVQMEMANVSVATQAMAGIVTEVGVDIKAGIASIQSLLYNSNIALQIAQDQLDQMQVIADNTAMLNETNNRLKAIEQNTSKL